MCVYACLCECVCGYDCRYICPMPGIIIAIAIDVFGLIGISLR